MSGLELKVPPDVVWLVVAASMWAGAIAIPALSIAGAVRALVAGPLLVVGIALIVAARVELNRAHTTWHPTEPGRATSLVTSGVFRYSRNPTYLGMWFALGAWAVVLASPVALALTSVFVLYLSRFQIRPEERALTTLFGRQHDDYARRVRRWI